MPLLLLRGVTLQFEYHNYLMVKVNALLCIGVSYVASLRCFVHAYHRHRLVVNHMIAIAVNRPQLALKPFTREAAYWMAFFLMACWRACSR
ncbi:hypothetical protein SSYM_2014 [Serratia symbiotica str. Tucson]|uniref:Uncharacterized protein n=1 Tax=Serratia symbiotica str. Tucson TaxID=914128 RepID=E9CNK9_9GAMM|nr:hypothetical protein SSYM_2014 [Serratia symbiotica str. Tucson]